MDAFLRNTLFDLVMALWVIFPSAIGIGIVSAKRLNLQGVEALANWGMIAALTLMLVVAQFVAGRYGCNMPPWGHGRSPIFPRAYCGLVHTIAP